MLIYKATNKIDNKCYIGQTIQKLSSRIYRHIYDSKNFKNRCPYFHSALLKYGKDNFKWTILEICFDIDELNEKEEWYIKHFNSFGDGGYNLNYGGNNKEVSADTKKKQSLSHKGKVSNNKGKSMSEEQKKKLSIAHTGKKFSIEHRNSISKSNKGRVVTENTKDKISRGNKGHKHTNESKLLMSTNRKKKNS